MNQRLRVKKWANVAVVLMMAILVLGGCASSKKSMSLTDTLAAYGNAVRWEDFPSAARFLDPKVAAEISELDLERYRQLKVSSYTEQQINPDRDEETVRQTVEIGIVNRHTGVERRVIDRQVWRWEEATERWLLMSGLPDVTQERY
ncbi:MAG: hypothetical protein DHS20C11_04070 [Lysobacteraceae bacterium]|nr:MAG: hypothetical protein DHS20C11_04070 [Xanthomonadaceae bacterium]